MSKENKTLVTSTVENDTQPATEKSINISDEKIPTKEKIFYGIGAFMDGGGVAMMSCVMVAYMHGYLGIPLGIATLIFMIAKIWDAITDPIMAFITDNTRSKFGRRKPYMFWGGIGLLLCIFLVFLPVVDMGMPKGGTEVIVYITFMYLLWNTISTVTQVPYCSMASDISPSFKERNNANTVKLVFNAIASGLAYVLPLVFIEALTKRPTELEPNITPGFMGLTIEGLGFWLGMSIIFGLMFGGGLILCSIFVKERIKPNKPVEKFNGKRFVYGYAAPYKNKSYRAHIGMYITAFMCMDIISSLAVLYATDVWAGYKVFGAIEMSSMFIVAPMMVSAVIMFPLARVMMDKKGKAFAFRMGLPFYIAGGIMLAIFNPKLIPNAPVEIVPVISIMMGLGFGGAQMMPWIIFPDTVDVEEMATGNRPTGTYSGMMTLARKVAGALGVFLTGQIIDSFGYVSGSAPEEAKVAICVVLGVSVAIFISIALFFSFKYKITTKRLERVRYFIEARKNRVILSSDEIDERSKLIKLLYGKNNTQDEIEYQKALSTGDFSNIPVYVAENEEMLSTK